MTTHDTRGPNVDPRVAAEFARFDEDDNGRIDRAEFGRLVAALGAGLSVSEADRAFTDIDRNGDGSVDAAEFARWWRFRG